MHCSVKVVIDLLDARIRPGSDDHGLHRQRYPDLTSEEKVLVRNERPWLHFGYKQGPLCGPSPKRVDTFRIKKGLLPSAKYSTEKKSQGKR
jgi:hypothetical protein